MNEAYLFRIASDEPIRIWTGNGDLYAPPCPFEPSGAIYSGMGELSSIPALQSLINGIAQRVEFVVSGISSQIIANAYEERYQVYQKECKLGTITMDADFQTIGVVALEWKGVCDVLSTQISTSEEGVQRVLSLSVYSGDTSRSRARYAFFTDASQRRRSPTDAFFSNIASISQGVTRRFGPK